jgi:hypothetical protein
MAAKGPGYLTCPLAPRRRTLHRPGQGSSTRQGAEDAGENGGSSTYADGTGSNRR